MDKLADSPSAESDADNLLALLDYDKKLAAMKPRELVFEVLGSKAADFRCVIALMDRVVPGWHSQFTDEETESGPPSTERFEPMKAVPGARQPVTQDTVRLNWLIKHGYTPAKWRPWQPSDGPASRFPNGQVSLGRGSRLEIDLAMSRSV